MKARILIADTDDLLTDLLASYLKAEGYELFLCRDGEKAKTLALSQDFDAIILDLLLPVLNGFELISTIREQKQTPILILTARADDYDKILGFELGADDYLLKPCHPKELLARLTAILKRSQQSQHAAQTIEYQNIYVDCSKRVAMQHGKFLELTNAEFNILELLLKSPDKAFSKEILTEIALGRKYTAYDRSIDVHISNLRSKLGVNAEGESFVKTLRGFGYSFSANGHENHLQNPSSSV